MTGMELIAAYLARHPANQAPGDADAVARSLDDQRVIDLNPDEGPVENVTFWLVSLRAGEGERETVVAPFGAVEPDSVMIVAGDGRAVVVVSRTGSWWAAINSGDFDVMHRMRGMVCRLWKYALHNHAEEYGHVARMELAATLEGFEGFEDRFAFELRQGEVTP